MPAISANLNSFSIEFENSWDIAYQQMDSTLRDAVDSKGGQGERMRGQILDSIEATEYNERGGETVYSDLDADHWNVFPQPAEVANQIDEWDEAYLGQIVRPDSDVVRAHAAAIARQIDNKIVRAFTATAYRGKNGTSTAAFDTTNQRVASTYKGPLTGAACGLNFYKVARAAKIMDDNEVPMSGRSLVMRAAQMEDLVNDVILNHSGELSSIKSMSGNNRVFTEILGFKVIQSQRVLVADSVTNAGTDVASCIAFHKNAVQLAVWGDRNTRMDILPESRHALAIRTTVNVGATRKRDAAVIEVLADQSP
jgi:hypothetical protein